MRRTDVDVGAGGRVRVCVRAADEVALAGRAPDPDSAQREMRFGLGRTTPGAPEVSD
jgi:hypothetical protein